MRILFVDDDWERHKHFVMANLGHDIAHACTAADAIELLRGKQFDEVWLDYDLDLATQRVVDWRGRVLHEARGTWADYIRGGAYGHEVAKHLGRMEAAARPHRVLVHSANPGGALKMLRALRRAGYDPVRIEDLRYEDARTTPAKIRAMR